MGSIKITKTDSTKAKGDKILPVITKTEAMILKEIETVGSSYRVIKEYNCSGEPIAIFSITCLFHTASLFCQITQLCSLRSPISSAVINVPNCRSENSNQRTQLGSVWDLGKAFTVVTSTSRGSTLAIALVSISLMMS